METEGYWELEETVEQYSTRPYLWTGEQLSLSHCFSEPLEGKRVLDLACGGGRVSYFLQKMGARVTGIDSSNRMISRAMKRLPEIDLGIGDASYLGFRDASFEAVCCMWNSLDCLHPKALRLQCLREIWRVLRPGGVFVFSHHNLAAIIFGWPGLAGIERRGYRISRILDGSVFRTEQYLSDSSFPGMKIYFAWPSQILKDLKNVGFLLERVFPNSRPLAALQRYLRSDLPVKLVEPFPYLVCRKPGAL